MGPGLPSGRVAGAHHLRRVEFLGQFVLNALAPVNFPLTNPEVLAAAAKTGVGAFDVAAHGRL